MTIPKLKPTQEVFLKAVFSGEYRFMMYAGRVNTGKSWLVSLFCAMTANDYDNTRIAVIRKDLPTAKRTILKTYQEVLELLNIDYTLNRSDWVITLADSNSTIEFISADHTKDPDLNKVKGLNVNIIHIEEANEVIPEVFNITITRFNRWKASKAPPFIFLTCNPNNTWVKTRFRDEFDNGTLKKPFYFLEPAFDEIPEEDREFYRSLPAVEYQRYIEGDWNYSDDPQQLIPFEWIRRNYCDPSVKADALSIDPARYGNDRTVFAMSYQERLAAMEVFRKQDTTTTANIAIERMKEKSIGADKTIVDVVGLGAGVVDPMRAQGYSVKAFNSAEKSEKYHGLFEFKNMRSEAYWTLREKLENDSIKLLNDPELVKELTNIRYIIKDKTIYIESKDDIKKRLGFSPDKADAVSMLFTLDNKPVIVSTGRNRAFQEFDQKNNATRTRTRRYRE